MAHIVTEACVRCKYTDCVEQCPVDCFHEGENALVIDPVECIDCRACVEACPAKAIFFEEDLPPGQEEWIALNKRLAAVWPVLKFKQDAMPDADAMRDVPGKRAMLSEKPGR